MAGWWGWEGCWRDDESPVAALGLWWTPISVGLIPDTLHTPSWVAAVWCGVRPLRVRTTGLNYLDLDVPTLSAHVGVLGSYGLSVDLSVPLSINVSTLLQVIAASPNVTFILDHVGYVPVGDTPAQVRSHPMACLLLALVAVAPTLHGPCTSTSGRTPALQGNLLDWLTGWLGEGEGQGLGGVASSMLLCVCCGSEGFCECGRAGCLVWWPWPSRPHDWQQAGDCTRLHVCVSIPSLHAPCASLGRGGVGEGVVRGVWVVLHARLQFNFVWATPVGPPHPVSRLLLTLPTQLSPHPVQHSVVHHHPCVTGAAVGTSAGFGGWGFGHAARHNFCRCVAQGPLLCVLPGLCVSPNSLSAEDGAGRRVFARAPGACSRTTGWAGIVHSKKRGRSAAGDSPGDTGGLPFQPTARR